LVGIAPVHRSLVGSVESIGDAGRASWLKKLGDLGASAG
jgi:hypothetical protein